MSIREEFTREERLALDAAIGQSSPCKLEHCGCQRRRTYSFGVPCTCYRIQQSSQEPIACCLCGLLEAVRDDRFLGYLLAWRRMRTWHVDDRGEDAIPGMGTMLLQLFKVAPTATSDAPPWRDANEVYREQVQGRPDDWS